MTAIITAATLLTALFLIAVAIRVFQREKPILYVLIPVILLFAVSTGYAINEMKGYATRNLSDLQKEFVYLGHWGDDPVFLLTIPQGAVEPRLYALPSDMLNEKSRQGLSESAAKTKQQVMMFGRFAEGEYQTYRFDAERLPPKVVE